MWLVRYIQIYVIVKTFGRKFFFLYKTKRSLVKYLEACYYLHHTYVIDTRSSGSKTISVTDQTDPIKLIGLGVRDLLA